MAKKSNKQKVTVWDLRVREHPEFGQVVEFTCPGCQMELRTTEAAPWLRVLKCRCGIEWEVILKAVGEIDGPSDTS